MPRTLVSILSASLLLLLLASCTQKSNEAAFGKGNTPATASTSGNTPPLNTDKKKASYIVGVDIAKTLQPVAGELDPDAVAAGLTATLRGEPSKIDEATAARIRQSFSQQMRTRAENQQTAQASRNKQQGEAFLAQNKAKPGVKTTASGLQYEVLRAGNGPVPRATDNLSLHYTGSTLDGAKFDSSYDRNEPAELVPDQALPGLREALLLMPIGSKYRIWLPSSLAYGANGAPQIGADAALVYEVELLDVAKSR